MSCKAKTGKGINLVINIASIITGSNLLISTN